MITYVKLKNYKSLVDFKVNFMKKKNTPKKMVLIYGENGIGKSNLANSFFTLNETTRTMFSVKMARKMLDELSNVGTLKNDEQALKNREEFVRNYIKNHWRDTKTIISECKTIDSNENMVLEYGFMLDNKEGVYHIEFNNDEIVKEKLDYVLNKNLVSYFDISNEHNYKINVNIFKNKSYYNDFLQLIDKYWGKHSFMSILSSEIEEKTNEYMNGVISDNLYKIFRFFIHTCVKIKKSNHFEYSVVGTNHDLIDELDNGTISVKEETKLDKAEELLNEIFTSLYSDIKKVYYQKSYDENNLKYKLYIKKMIYGKIKDIDFSLESTGTQNILELIPFLISACEGQTVIIDELDNGIHDLMVKSLLETVEPYIKGQLIITTHNTLLINSMPKESIYIFNADKDANKELISLDEFPDRIQKNNSPQKKYLSGLLGGIPITNDIDFEELIENLD